MTRKEYLKMRKKKNKRKKSKITYVLIVCLLLLSVYVFTQLYVYSANRSVVYNPGDKVYEDYYDIYFAVPSYTYNVKYDLVSVSADGVEKNLMQGEGFYNIQKVEDRVYGIKDKKVYYFDLITGETKEIIGNESLAISKFIINEDKIYLVAGNPSEGKLYVANIDGSDLKEIYSKYVYQLFVENNAIYIIANEKSNYNLIKIDELDYKSEIMISDKIVNNIYGIEDYIYFVNGSDENKLYRINKKDFTDIKKMSDLQVIFDYKYENLNGEKAILQYNENIYFVSSDDTNKLCKVDKDGNNTETILDIQIQKIRLKDRYIFYTVKDELGIFSYNIDTGDLRKVSEKRFSEFVF